MNIAVQFAFALHLSYSGFDIAPHHCLGIHINANFMLVLVAGKGKFLLFAFTSLPTMQFGQNYLSLPGLGFPFYAREVKGILAALLMNIF